MNDETHIYEKETSENKEAGEEVDLLVHDQRLRPLGLKLKKSPSFVNLVQSKLSNGDQVTSSDGYSSPKSSQSKSKPKPKPNDLLSLDKLKASNFPAIMLNIGSFKRVSMHESDLVVKLYYAKRKLVWEFLDGPLKKKIEIQWSDIEATRATNIEDGQFRLWEIELKQPPLFYHESNPQPRKHTLWQLVNDFTNGEASRFRRHNVKFAQGVLDKHYEKLLQYDSALYRLSQQPFPTQSSQFFTQPNPFYQGSNMPFNFQRNHTPFILQQPHLHQTLPSHINTYNPNNSLLPPNMYAQNTNTNNIVHVFGQNNQTQRPISPFSNPNNFVSSYQGYHHQYMINQSKTTTSFNFVEENCFEDPYNVPIYDIAAVATTYSILPNQNLNPNQMEASSTSIHILNSENNVFSDQMMENLLEQDLDVDGAQYNQSTWMPSQNTGG